jgi:hypothetical protein
MEQPSDIVDDHIDDFIQVGRHRWDVVCFIIDRDPIYDIEGSSQVEGLKCHLQRTGLHTCMIQIFGSLVMIWLQICSSPSRMTCHNILRVIFIHPLIHTLLRMQICSMRTFSHYAQILIDTRSWPTQSSPGPHYQMKYFHVETLGRDLQTKKRRFPSPKEEFFSKVVPYPISSCLGNHRVFLGSLVLSQPSGSSDF